MCRCMSIWFLSEASTDVERMFSAQMTTQHHKPGGSYLVFSLCTLEMASNIPFLRFIEFSMAAFQVDLSHYYWEEMQVQNK